MPLPSLFLADILGVLYIAKSRLPFRSFVLHRRCTIVPNHIFIIKIVFKSRYVIVSKMSILRTSVSLLSHSLAFTLFIVQCTEKGREKYD